MLRPLARAAGAAERLGGLLRPLSRAAGAAELLDAPAPFADLCASLADMARLNGLGGRMLTLAHARRLLRRLPPGRPAIVLDVGTGGGDLPLALARWARRAGRPLRVLALDRDAATLVAARGAIAAAPGVALVRGDATALPLRDRAVDVAVSALTLHHLEPPEAIAYLAELDRVSRLGFVVNDLVRSRAAYGLVWLATRLLAAHPMSRHDGPLSVRRAYTAREIERLLERAGVSGARVRRYAPLARLCAVRGPA
jgi:ubiquinone/menaquinone biosynthesis C-methylase UbiE